MNKQSNFQIMSRLIKLVRPLSGYMLLAILLGLIGNLCAAVITILAGYALLSLLGLSTGISVTGAFVFAGIAAVIRAFLRYGEQSCNHYIAFKLLALIRDLVFKALRRLAPAKLEVREKGDLISLITSDIELLEVFYAHTISPVVIAALMSVIMTLFIGSFHWLLGLTALIAYLMVGVVIPLTASKATKLYGQILRGKIGALSAFVLDSLRGLREIIQFGAGSERLEKMNHATAALSEEEGKHKGKASKFTAATHGIIMVFNVAITFLSAMLYTSGQVGFEGVIIPVIALMSSYGPVIALSALGSSLQNTIASGSRVLEILDESPVTEEIHGKPPVQFTGAEAQNVTFSYGGQNILTNVSVPVPKNSVIGIIGKSGSGKSTLLKLLLRFWDVQLGRIKISGQDIRNINTSDLRDMESYMTQETHLFHDSLINNLRIAKPDATLDEVQDACKKASVHEFIIGLKDGYETKTGELGDTLSGGEKQRIGLARAFLHSAPLMILDEPTSNLDSLNEAVILKSLGEERQGKTIVLVSHRESTMKITDKVYSITSGRLS